MKEFIEKLIGRLEEEKEGKLNLYCDGLSFAIRTVNQLAEEYINCSTDTSTDCSTDDGWIACSEKLPEEEGYYLITIRFYHLHNPVVMGCHFEDGEWWKIDKEDKVLAWRELPAPYQPKGE